MSSFIVMNNLLLPVYHNNIIINTSDMIVKITKIMLGKPCNNSYLKIYFRHRLTFSGSLVWKKVA